MTYDAFKKKKKKEKALCPWDSYLSWSPIQDSQGPPILHGRKKPNGREKRNRGSQDPTKHSWARASFQNSRVLKHLNIHTYNNFNSEGEHLHKNGFFKTTVSS